MPRTKVIRGGVMTYNQRRNQLIAMIDRLHDINDVYLESVEFIDDDSEAHRIMDLIERCQNEIVRLEALLEYNRVHNTVR